MLVPKSTGSTAAALLSSLLLSDGVQGKSPTVVNNTQDLTGFTPCDALIAAELSHAVHLPSSPLYPSLVNGSWASSTRKQPWCFVVPSTPTEVSQTLTALRSAGEGAGDWHVAIRSGGHGSDNQNNIAQGVIIDMTHMNTTTYDAETNIASVESGARWQSVYDTLEQDGVSATGGREGVVGVGGLILGGGVSWYTARTGFACDSVVNFEVVIASGEIVNANASANSDLWRALKGGNSNFGIVTRFDLEAFPAENLSIARRIIGPEHTDELVEAIAGFTELDRSFEDNALITIMTYDPDDEESSTEVVEVNTMNKPNRTAYNAFNRIPTLEPATHQSLSLAESANRSQVAQDGVNAGAGTLTLANDPRVMRYCIEQHNNLVEELKATLGPKNFRTILDFQPFPSYFADIGVEKGGNMLGLERDSRNKIIFILGVTLIGPNKEDMASQLYQQVTAIYAKVEAYSKSIGRSEDFTYLPYADARQDPIGSYGAANIEHIRNVANKYDPNGFFQRRVPGGFKIDRVA